MARSAPAYSSPAAPNGQYDPLAGEKYDQGRVYHIKAWHTWSDRRKVMTMRRMVEDYGGDPRMRWFTAQVLEKSGAAPRDYPAQAAALLKFVQDSIYYTNEPNEQIQSPWRTLSVKNGDCFAEGTLVLRDDYELVPIEQVKVGDRIWGYDKWSIVQDWAAKGALPVWEIGLNNGSTIRLTADHKVWAWSCERHGPNCPDFVKGARNCAIHGVPRKLERFPVSEVRPGWRLAQPERIADGGRDEDPDLAWLDGVFVADGWTEQYKCCIAGQDGKPKEAQKRRVASIVERYGGTTHWHRKYITLHTGTLTDRLRQHGSNALDKHLVGLDRTARALYALDEGLQADASRNSQGAGWTFGTINRTIAVQYRVLQRLLGRSTSWRCVEKHGGFGKNPIYRVGVRQPSSGRADKALAVKSVQADVAVVQTYDITTDDHFVYLPEADCSVSQCDDMGILLASMAESVSLPWRFALGGHRQINPKHDKKLRPLVEQWERDLRSERADVRAVAKANLAKAAHQRVRWVEGQPWPSGARFSHIYVMLGNQPFKPTAWASAEPTVRGMPLGHDVVLHGLPEGARGGRDLGGWSEPTDLRLPVKRFAGPSGFGAPTVIDAVGEVEGAEETWWQQGEGLGRAVWRNLDKPGLINSVVQGVMTAVAVGATGYYLAKHTKLRV